MSDTVGLPIWGKVYDPGVGWGVREGVIVHLPSLDFAAYAFNFVVPTVLGDELVSDFLNGGLVVTVAMVSGLISGAVLMVFDAADKLQGVMVICVNGNGERSAIPVLPISPGGPIIGLGHSTFKALEIETEAVGGACRIRKENTGVRGFGKPSQRAAGDLLTEVFFETPQVMRGSPTSGANTARPLDRKVQSSEFRVESARWRALKLAYV